MISRYFEFFVRFKPLNLLQCISKSYKKDTPFFFRCTQKFLSYEGVRKLPICPQLLDVISYDFSMGSRKKKVLLLLAGPLREGWGKEPGHQVKKRTFLGSFYSKISTAIKLEGGGEGLCLNARPLRAELFLRLP